MGSLLTILQTANEKSEPSKDAWKLPPELRSACTRNTKTRVCQLLGHLVACNQLLWHVGLELREEAQGELGDLRVGVIPTGGSALCDNTNIESERVAVALLHHLFTLHRCVVAVDLNSSVVRHRFLVGALEDKSCLTRLRVFGLPSNERSLCDSVSDLVTSLVRLEELTFWDQKCPSFLQRALSVLLLQRGDVSLTTLDVAAPFFNPSEARDLIAGLTKNNTITELAIGRCVFETNREGGSKHFAKYLAKKNGVLKKLSLVSPDYWNGLGLRTVLETISTMSTLEELDVNLCLCNAEHTTLFPDVVAGNRSLRLLKITAKHHYNGAVNIQPWLLALRDNSVLSELTIDLQGVGGDDCCAFFRELADNKSLAKVTVHNLPDTGCLQDICRAIRERGLTQRVLIGDHLVTSADLPTLPECQEATHLVLSAWSFDTFSVLPALHVLSNSTHVRRLFVQALCGRFDQSMNDALATFLEANSSLRDLEIHLYGSWNGEEREEVEAGSFFVRSLSTNTDLRRIAFQGLCLSNSECRILSDAVLQSPNLSELQIVTPTRLFNAALVRFLASGVENNFRLLSVVVPIPEEHDAQVQQILDATRRNSGLVMRAARFVMGERDEHCVRAVELVSRHPRLVEIVQEQAATGATEAIELIRRSLNIQCLTGLTEYMKITGVVSRRVRCSVRQEARIQLDTLDDYSWLMVRRYIKVADVSGD